MLVTHDPTVGALAQRMVRMRDGAHRHRRQHARRDRRDRLTVVSLILLVVLSIPFAVILARSPLIRRLSTRHAFATTGRGAARHRRLAARHRDHHGLAHRRRHHQPIDPGRGVRPARAGRRDRLGAAPRRSPRSPSALRGFSSPSVDGVLSMTSTPAAVVHARPGRGHAATGPAARGRLRRGAAPSGATLRPPGSPGATPAAGVAAVTSDLADKFGLRLGSRIVVFAGGGHVALTVDRILPAPRCRGLSGRWTPASSRTTCSSPPARSRR